MTETTFQNHVENSNDEDESDAEFQTNDESSNTIDSTSDLLSCSLSFAEPFHNQSALSLFPASSLYDLHPLVAPLMPPQSPFGAPGVTAATAAAAGQTTFIPVAQPYMLTGGFIIPNGLGVSDLMLRHPSPGKGFPPSGDEGIYVCRGHYTTPQMHGGGHRSLAPSAQLRAFGLSAPPSPPSLNRPMLLSPEAPIQMSSSSSSYSYPSSDMMLQTSFSSSSSSPSSDPSSSSHLGLPVCPPSFIVAPSSGFSGGFCPLPSPPSSSPASSSPLVFVSPAGLLTVVLHNDVTVEMTLDRSVRVVNHPQRAVVATNSRGDVSCVYHVAAKILQDRTTTEMTIHGEKRVRMSTAEISFAYNSDSPSYTLTPFGLKVQPECVFSDLSKDMSVTLLFSSSGYGPHLMTQYDEVTKSSRYRFHRNGAVTVVINGVRIHQTPQSDVIVTSGRKYLRVSPETGLARVVTHFVEMTVEGNRTVRMRRGGHRVLATHPVLILANDEVEFGFDECHQLFFHPVTVKRETIIYKGRRVFPGKACLHRPIGSPASTHCEGLWPPSLPPPRPDSVGGLSFTDNANFC